jgi:hypothetical protein
MLGAHIEVVLEIIVGGSDVGHTFELQDDEHAQLLHGLFSSASKGSSQNGFTRHHFSS